MSDLQKLSPFKYFVLTNFPFIEADFDALTNYELMCEVTKYINQISDRQNEVIDAFNNLETDFTQLETSMATYRTMIDYKIAQFQEWFDNLDVQDEINTKLDQMAQDGSLSDLVSPFIPSVVTAWLAEHITQPTNPVVDSSLTVSGAAADAKVTGDRITDVNTALDASINTSGLFPIDLELGDINFNYSPWRFSESTTRVRNKEGVKIHLQVGDIISFRFNRLLEIYVGWYDLSGNNHHSDAYSKSFTVSQEGFYNFTIRVSTGTISLDTVKESLYIYRPNKNFANQVNNYLLYHEYDITTIPGYIDGSGAIITPTNKIEKTTGLIPVKEGDIIFASLEYFDTENSPSMFLAMAKYNKYGDFITRYGIVSNQNGVYKTSTKIVIDNGTEYVRFTFGTWGDNNFSFTIKTPDYYNMKLHDADNKLKILKAKETHNINSILHRGAFGYPENTLIGFRKGKEQGFDIVECDVRFTSDGVPVLLHDVSINRTARNTDGTSISETVNIADITYSQALSYNFGGYMGFENISIPTFAEFLTTCKKMSINPYVEIKAGTTEQIAGLITIAKNSGMLDSITWIADDGDRLDPIINTYNKARIGLVVSSVQDWVITRLNTLKTEENEVFAFSSDYGDTSINKCKNADIPLEVWVIDTSSEIISINPYITGIESNLLIAQEVMYESELM